MAFKGTAWNSSHRYRKNAGEGSDDTHIKDILPGIAVKVIHNAGVYDAVSHLIEALNVLSFIHFSISISPT